MKILQVSDFYPPVIGGLEKYVQLLSATLAERGHEVTVATLAPAGSEPTSFMDGSVRVRQLRGWTRHIEGVFARSDMNFHPTVPDPGIVKGLQKLIKAERPDVINVHSWMSHSLLAVPDLHGAKLVMTLHDYGVVCAKKTFVHSPDGEMCSGPGLFKCISCAGEQYGTAKAAALSLGMAADAPLLGRVDAFIAVGSSVGSVGNEVSRRAPVHVIPGFVPDSLIDAELASDSDLTLPDEFVLFVGALGLHKGLDVVLRAHQQDLLGAPLVLIGGMRPDTPPIPDDVTVIHDLAHEQVMQAWALASVAVVPSTWAEPFGLVALEAMIAKTPVVASNIGGLADIVDDGVSGLLVTPGDHVALGVAVKRLLEDRTLAASIGDAGHRRVDRFRQSIVVTEIEALYRSVAGV